MASLLIQADRAVSELHERLEKRLESQRKFRAASIPSVQDTNHLIVPKLSFPPKKPSDTCHPNMSPMASGRTSYHTARNAEVSTDHTILKSQQNEIKLLRLAVEQLTKDRDRLFAQNTKLMCAPSEIEYKQPGDSEMPEIRILQESKSQSLGLYSCEMVDPMKRVPRSFRLRVLARHRKQSPTKTIISTQGRASLANVADYTSEPAQRVAYTSGRLMAQYMLDADSNDRSTFASLSTYCTTKLAHARQVEHCSSSSAGETGRQALKAFVNPFTLATACDCMIRLIEACPMYRDVMNEVFAEIMVGIYAPDTIHYQGASDSPNLHKPAPADALQRHLNNIPYCELNRFLGSDLFLAQTELKDSWTLAKRVLLVEDSLNMIIQKSLQTHNIVLLRIYCHAWMEALNCRKIWRETFLRKAAQKYRILHQSKAFCAWKACLDLALMEKKIVDLTASLADEQRVSSGEMWSLNDQIKRSDEEIASLRLKMADYTTLFDNAIKWRKRSTDITGHVLMLSNHCNDSEMRIPFPITNIYDLFPEEQKLFSQNALPSTSTYVRGAGQPEANQQLASSGTSRPGTSANSRADQSGSRPGTSNRPGSAGQPQALEMMVARLLSSNAEEIIARMVLAATGVAITGWSDKIMLSGLLHSKMLDFMQMQEYETVHKDPEAAVDIWGSVLGRAKLLSATFHESVTTVESLMGRAAAPRCILMADIILNCGCPPISPLWAAFRRRFVAQSDGSSTIAEMHLRMQQLVSSQDAAQELASPEDAGLSGSLENFVKECPDICEASLNVYRDTMEFASCMRVVHDFVRRWFSTVSLKLGKVKKLFVLHNSLPSSQSARHQVGRCKPCNIGALL
jgi:hypothetical protein